MKNLKKVLSFILVISMLMSLCTFVFATGDADADAMAEQKAAQIDINSGDPVYYTWDAENGEFDDETPSDDPVVKNSDKDTKVWLSKTIAPTGTENEFNITLDVWTKNVEINKSVPAPAAVTLVVDLSGSMHSCSVCNATRSGSNKLNIDGKDYHIKDSTSNKTTNGTKCYGVDRLAAAKAAAKEFIKTYAGYDATTDTTTDTYKDPGAARYISIAWFSNESGIITREWYDLRGNGTNIDARVSEINKQIDNGLVHKSSTTNTSGGLKQAENLLADYAVKDLKNKFVILLTDGAPYGDTDVRKTDGNGNINSVSGYELPNSYDGQYSYKDANGQHTGNYADVGKSGNPASNTENGYPTGFEYGARRAFRIRGTGANQLNTTLYSIAFGHEQSIATCWLDDISDACYTAKNADRLKVAFDTVNESIKSAVQPWIVTDPMGEYIICTKNYDNNSPASLKDNVLTWNLQKARGTTEGDGITSYTETYRIKLDVKQAIADSKDLSEVFLTNGETTLKYSLPVTESNNGVENTYFVDNDGNKVTGDAVQLNMDFKVPAVKGYAADLSFEKQGYQAAEGSNSKTMQPLPGAKFKLANGTVWSQEKNSGTDGKVEFTWIPSGASYTLTEETTPAGFDSVAPMTITVSYGVISGLNAPDGKVTDPVHVNKIPVPITKKWVAPANEIPDTITVTLLCNGKEISDEYTNVVIGPNAANKVTVDENGLWHYTFTELPETDENGEPYTYTVVETEPNGFTEAYGDDGLSITNTITGTTTVKVVKNWILPEGFNSTVPDVTVTLTADGAPTTNTAVLGNGGSAEFTVDKYNNGTPIKYSATEAGGNYQQVSTVSSVVEGVQTITITNTLADEKTTKSGEKIWRDDNDASARQDVTVELLKDGVQTGMTRTASAPNWTYTFDGLDKYEFIKDDKGNITGVREIVYTVDEITAFEGYTSEASGMDVINTRTGTTEFTVYKVWEDVPGATHGNVTVTLRANGTPMEGEEYTQSFAEFYTFQNLDKYDNMGKVIVYDVVETPVEGYTTRYTPNPVTAGTYEQTVINTKVNDDVVTLSITKEWKQPTDPSGQTATFIVTGTVSSDCPEAEEAVIVDETQFIIGNGTITPEYPKYYEYYDEETGETTFYEYTYTVTENAISGYTTTGGAVADAANTWKFVNTITDNTTVTVKKNWVKPDDVAKVDVTFNVYQNASETPYTTITIKADDADATESVSVPKYDGNGQIITYTVSENVPYGFSASAPVQTAEGVWEFTVTNTVNPAKKDITVSKTWLDDSRAAAERPDVTLYLSNAGSVTFHYDEATAKVMAIIGEESYEADVSDDGNTYSYKFTGLDVYNEAMTGYVTYELTEPVYPEGYTGTVSNMVATNRRVGTASIPITKIWTDPTGSERPDITLVLTGDGKTYEVVFSKDADTGVVTATLGDEVLGTVSGSSWTVYVPVPKYDAMGKEIDYTLTEKPVPGYTQRVVEGQKFMIENVIEQDYVDISAVKVWDNMVEEGEDVVIPAKYPEAITVALYRDNIQVADTEQTAELDDETGEYVIEPYTGLDKYNLQTGAVYMYTIKETSNGSAVEDGGTVSFGADNNYVVTYSTDNDGNIVIKNTYQVPAKYLYDVTCYYYHYDWTGKQISFHQTVSDMMTETVQNTQVTANPETFKVCKVDNLTYNFDEDNEENALKVVLEEENHLYHLYIYYILTDAQPYIPPYYPPEEPNTPPTPPTPPETPENPPEEEEFEPEETPLAALPVEEPEEEIFEDDVPLANVPHTNDAVLFWLACAALSGLALLYLNLKKRKDENA